MAKRQGTLSDILDELRASTPRDPERIAVGDLIDALDHRGYGPALVILPLTELTPIGGVPGYPTALALVLAVIAVRLLLGHEHFWAPDWLRRRTLRGDRVMAALDWLKPITLRIDAELHERLRPLAGRQGRRAACVVILCLVALVPPLEFVPFATSVPMLVISTFGLGLLFRDGLVMLVGFLGTGLAATGILWVVFG